MLKRGHGETIKAPPDERGGNRYVLPNATAPHLDSTDIVAKVSNRGATIFSPEDKTGSDRRLIWPQAYYRKRTFANRCSPTPIFEHTTTARIPQWPHDRGYAATREDAVAAFK